MAAVESGAGPALRQLGPYRIEGVLGDGAMGRVYLAHEEVPNRQVALKVLRSFGQHQAVEWRFRREIELLGGLEHPHIARLYAGGQLDTPEGPVAYLAMEVVRGEDLARYVEHRRLPPRECLRLLAKIARAVHHAHTRGVIHRDLKPANILVDEHGEPRILDFGVAHVIGDEATQLTAAGEILGTVPYMAPEQLAGEARALDPRCDVYALGVIAYRLLAGQMPYPGIESMTVVGALGVLLRQQPQRLSRVAPQTRGDIETLVMKAMAADRAQRYDSAADLAADIERVLAYQPIQARPPTLRYVTGLMVRRHKLAAAAALALLIMLVAATAVSTHFAFAERQARETAEARLAEREAVNDFLREMLASADPQHAMGERLTVLNVLDAARGTLGPQSGLPGAAEAQLRRTLGNTYSGLGRNADALAELRAAQLLLDRTGASVGDRLRLRIETAVALAAAGQEQAAAEVIGAVVGELDADPAADPRLRLIARFRQAAILDQQGAIDEPERILLQAIAESTRLLGAQHRLTLEMQSQHTLSLHRQGRYADATRVGREVAHRLETSLGADHPRTLEALEILAVNLRDQDQLAEAEALLRRTSEAKRRVLGPEHPETLLSLGNLAVVLSVQQQLEEAWTIIGAAYRGLLDSLGPEAEGTIAVANYYALVASERKDYAEAVRVLGTLVAQARRRPEGPLPSDLVDFNNLGSNLISLQRPREALTVYDELLPLAVKQLGAVHAHTAIFRVNRAKALVALGDRRAAREELDLALPVLREQLGAEHSRVKATEAIRAGL